MIIIMLLADQVPKGARSGRWWCKDQAAPTKHRQLLSLSNSSHAPHLSAVQKIRSGEAPTKGDQDRNMPIEEASLAKGAADQRMHRCMGAAIACAEGVYKLSSINQVTNFSGDHDPPA